MVATQGWARRGTFGEQVGHEVGAAALPRDPGDGVLKSYRIAELAELRGRECASGDYIGAHVPSIDQLTKNCPQASMD